MIILTDTFNRREISRHRTVEAAAKAERKHLAAVRKANGPGSYVTYNITATDGRDISDEIERARMSLNTAYQPRRKPLAVDAGSVAVEKAREIPTE